MKAVKRMVIFLIVVVVFFQSATVIASSKSIYSPDPILGDADGDGKVTITDCTRIQRVIAYIDHFSDDRAIVSDVDGDGTVCILDATLIQKWLAQFDVIVPIGCTLNNLTDASESISAVEPATSVPTSQPSTKTPTEVPTAAPTTAPTKPVATTVPTTALTEPQYDPNAKQITLSGVTFDVMKVKASYSLDDSNCSTGLNIIIKPKSQIDPADITTVVNNGIISNVIDYTNPKFKESYLMCKSSDVLLGYDCNVIDSSGRPLAYVYAHYCGDKYYPYQTTIYGFEKASGSFSIDFYYKGQLIKRCIINVNVSSTDSGLQSILNTVRDVEGKCWNDSLTDQQKLTAFARYVKEHFSYANVKCVEGALYTAYAARDLGLQSMLLYPGGEENQNCDYHIVTYNLYQSAYVPGGHCACLVDFGDTAIRYDVQGGGYVIRTYSN